MIDRLRRFFELAEHRLVAAIFVAALGVRVMQALLYGIKTTSDSSNYLDYCARFAASPLSAVVTQPENFNLHINKLGFLVPFCSVQTITGGITLIWIAIQIVLSAFTTVLVYYTGKRLLSRTAGFVGAVWMIVLFEAFRYNTYILTEAMFTFTVVLSIWALTRYAVEPSRRNRLIVYGGLGWLAVTRPFGLPMVILWLTYDLIPVNSRLRVGLVSRNVPAVGFLVGLVVTMVALSRGYLADRMYRWLSDGRIFWSESPPWPYVDYGYVPRAGSNLLSLVVFNLDHIIVLGTLRVGAFLIPVLPLWRTNEAHLLNVFVLTPVIVGAIVAGYFIFRRRDLEVLTLWATPLLATMAIVAITFVNRSNRFRSPVSPVFVLLTAYAVYQSPRLFRWARAVHDRVIEILGGDPSEVEVETAQLAYDEGGTP